MTPGLADYLKKLAIGAQHDGAPAKVNPADLLLLVEEVERLRTLLPVVLVAIDFRSNCYGTTDGGLMALSDELKRLEEAAPWLFEEGDDDDQSVAFHAARQAANKRRR